MKNKKYIVLVFFIAFNLRLGISSVPPILAIVKESLALTNFQASLLTSIPVLFMGMFAFFSTRFQNQFGRIKGIIILLIILGLSTLSRGFAQNFILLLLTTLFIGASIAIIGPLLSGFIKQEFPDHSGLLVGTYSLSMGLGSVIASSVMLPLTQLFKGKWNYALAVWGIIALMVAFFCRITFPNDKKHYAAYKFKIMIYLKHTYVWKMILFFGIQAGIFYGFSTWISTFLINEGYSTKKSVVFLTLFTIIQMLGSFFIPTLMDKTGTIKSWISFCTGFLFIASLNFLFLNSDITNTLGIIFTAIGASGLFPIAMLMPICISEDPAETSSVTSIVQAGGYLLGGSIPILMGSIIDMTGDYNMLFWIIIISTTVLFVLGLSNIEKGVD